MLDHIEMYAAEPTDFPSLQNRRQTVRGAHPDPHYVDPSNRLGVGTLPFLEIPLTTDPARLQASGFPHELRIESGPFETWHRPIIEKHLRRLDAAPETPAPAQGRPGLPPILALCIFTHNYFAYDRAEEETSITLERMLDYLDLLARDRVLTPVTLQEMHARVQRGCC